MTNTGGAPPTTHRGQCTSELALVLAEPSALNTTLTISTAVQITNSFCGLTRGDATATASVNANHNKANLASQGVLRSVCSRGMGRDCEGGHP